MIQKRNKGLIVLVVIICIGLLSGCGGNESKEAATTDKPTVIKAGHVLATSSPYHLGMEKLAELIEERTDGRYVMELYPNGQIGNERDMIEGVQMGSLGMAIVASGPMANFAPELGVVDLPFLFRDYDHADKVFNGEIGQELMSGIDKAGFKALSMWENGFRNLTNNKRAINSVDDVEGLKIRTMENKMHQALWRELGVDPVPMAWGDAYTAMQQGAIDGQENPLPIILAMKVSEVNQYLAITEHVYAPAVLVMSGSMWDKVSDEDKLIIQECADEAGVYERTVSREQTENALKELESMGMTITHPDKSEFAEMSKEIKAELAKEFKEIFEKIENIQ